MKWYAISRPRQWHEMNIYGTTNGFQSKYSPKNDSTDQGFGLA
jgi:hypothetical protein